MIKLAKLRTQFEIHSFKVDRLVLNQWQHRRMHVPGKKTVLIGKNC